MLISYTNDEPGWDMRRDSVPKRGSGETECPGPGHAETSEAIMLILLSDGSGLTARQCATVLARAGHRVEALSPAGLCLCRMTRHVRRGHDVPAVGGAPVGGLGTPARRAPRRGGGRARPGGVRE